MWVHRQEVCVNLQQDIHDEVEKEPFQKNVLRTACTTQSKFTWLFTCLRNVALLWLEDEVGVPL